MAEMSISRKQMPSYYKRKKIILLSLSTSMISLEHIITPQGLERITSQACKWMSQRDMNHHSNKSFIHRSLLAAGRPCHRWSVALQQAAPLVHAISSKQATPGFITGDLQQASNTASTCNLRQAVLVSNLLHKIQAWLMSWQLPVATATAILVHTIQKEMPSYLQLFGRPAIPLQPATFADPMSFHLATSLMALQHSSPCSTHL